MRKIISFISNDKSVVLICRKSIFVIIFVFPFSLKMANFEGKHTTASIFKI